MSKKFLVRAKYSSAGVGALLKSGGTTRQKAIEKMVNDLGGSLDAFYYTINTDEVYTLCTLPDTLSAAAISLNVDATGMADCNIIELLSPEEVDQASKMIVHYRAPGQ